MLTNKLASRADLFAGISAAVNLDDGVKWSLIQ